MDRSLQTLDRDLPVVIERVRETGLVPVFLIDELDKLEDPGRCIEVIVRRLKNLTTDYGFFCFLTDRAYFEEVEAKLRATAYPTEHTFFSHRLLLLYRPAELARYVRELLTGEPTDATAAWVLTCVVLHRARLNVMDVRRELARLCHDDGSLRPDPVQVVKDAQFLVPMAAQLAIEHVLRHRDIRLRVENDAAFAQLALDVLYMISRAWENGEDEVVISEAAVHKELVDRRCRDGDRDAAEAELAASATDADIATLTAEALQLARLMTSFPSIGSAIFAEPESLLPTAAALPPFPTTVDSEAAKLATLTLLLTGIPGVSDGLLSVKDLAYPDTFSFRFDRYGVGYVNWEETLHAVQQGLALFDDAVAALRVHRLDIATLVLAGVLPVTLDNAAQERSLASLRPAHSVATLRQVPREDIDRLTGFSGAVQHLRPALVGIVALTAQTAEESSGSPLDPAVVLAAIDRMLGIAPLVAVLSAPANTALPRQSLKSPTSPLIDAILPSPPVEGADEAEGITKAIDAARSRLRNLPQMPAGPSTWQERTARWVVRRERPVDPPINYLDITEAAKGSFPAGMLRPDLDAMTVAEWSRFSRDAFTNREWASWAFGAGLRALGFGQRILQEAGAEGFADGAPPDQPGVLFVFSPGGEFLAPPESTGAPVFAVPKAERDSYIEVVAWLTERNAFGGSAIEEG